MNDIEIPDIAITTEEIAKARSEAIGKNTRGKDPTVEMFGPRLTRSQAARMSRPTTGKLGLRGVTLERGRYRAKITYKCRRVHLGNFNTAEEAAEAYDRTAVKLMGKLAVLNYPEKLEEYLKDEDA